MKFCAMHVFHMTPSSKQQDVGNEINVKVDDGWESMLSPGADNALLLSSCKKVNI